MNRKGGPMDKTSKVVPITTRLKSSAERATGTRLDVIEVTSALLDTWRMPPAQRNLRVNPKIVAVAAEIAETQVIPGIITLGVLHGVTFVIDGQHRMHAFRLANIPMAYADVRIVHCADEAMIGAEFVRLNSWLAQMRPDDILRGLEAALPPLASVRERCAFIGYDMIRRGDQSPILSMSVALRSWKASQQEIPALRDSARTHAEVLTQDDADRMVEFLHLVYRAWGRDTEYGRLWNALNLTMTAWLYHRLVLNPVSRLKRSVRLTRAQFQKAAMALSANAVYLDWLQGRLLRDSDRSPCYLRMRAIMIKRLSEELGSGIKFPQPPWATRTGGGRTDSYLGE